MFLRAVLIFFKVIRVPIAAANLVRNYTLVVHGEKSKRVFLLAILILFRVMRIPIAAVILIPTDGCQRTYFAAVYVVGVH